jgi:hypothetical protein
MAVVIGAPTPRTSPCMGAQPLEMVDYLNEYICLPNSLPRTTTCTRQPVHRKTPASFVNRFRIRPTVYHALQSIGFPCPRASPLWVEDRLQRHALQGSNP